MTSKVYEVLKPIASSLLGTHDSGLITVTTSEIEAVNVATEKEVETLMAEGQLGFVSEK